MLFLTQGKTNWKYILIVLILAVIAGGGILGYLRYFEREIEFLTKFPEVKILKNIVEEKINKEEIANRKKECVKTKDSSSCFISLAKEFMEPSICNELKENDYISCYTEILEFFISLKNPALCERFSENKKGKILIGWREEIPVYREVVYKYECYERMAINLKNASLCEKINPLPFRNSCYIKVAFELKDPSICYNLAKFEMESSASSPEIYCTYFPERIKYLNSKEVCKQISQRPEPWKVYQNKEYGWEISYPNNFVVENGTFFAPEDILLLVSPEDDLGCGRYWSDFFHISIEKITTEQTLEEWLVNYLGLKEFKEFENTPVPTKFSIVVDMIKKITIGENIPAIRVRHWVQAFKENNRYIKHGNIIIVITTPIFSRAEDTPIFNQILSTFRFLK